MRTRSALLLPLLGLGLALSTDARAFTTSSSFFLRMGFLQDNFGRVAASDSGARGLVSAPLPALGINAHLAVAAHTQSPCADVSPAAFVKQQ